MDEIDRELGRGGPIAPSGTPETPSQR
jgi:hypothetical protein